MSTNQTTNYGLHSWEPEDDFLRAEINENFALLDGALGGLIITGSYTGNGASARSISLGFTPKAVLLFTCEGETNAYSRTSGGLFLQGYPLVNGNSTVAEIVDDGFRVYYASSSVFANWNNKRFHYLVIR